MKFKATLAASAAAVAVFGTFLIAAPAHAAPAPYERSSAMAEVVAERRASPLVAAPEQRGLVGVAKALAAGFKAANAPQAAGNVARLASILGFAAAAPQPSAELESAYFDR